MARLYWHLMTVVNVAFFGMDSSRDLSSFVTPDDIIKRDLIMSLTINCSTKCLYFISLSTSSVPDLNHHSSQTENIKNIFIETYLSEAGNNSRHIFLYFGL